MADLSHGREDVMDGDIVDSNVNLDDLSVEGLVMDDVNV